ncbi:MAG: hypothetical protein RR346_09005 [Bacteroidales bacterium]
MIEYKSPKGGITTREENGVVTFNGEYVCTTGQLKWMAENPDIILVRAFHVIASGIGREVIPEPIDLEGDSQYLKALFIDFRGGEKFLRFLWKFNGAIWSTDSNKGKIIFGADPIFKHPDAYDTRPIHSETPEGAIEWARQAMIRRYGADYMNQPFEELKRIDL